MGEETGLRNEEYINKMEQTESTDQAREGWRLYDLESWLVIGC